MKLLITGILMLLGVCSMAIAVQVDGYVYLEDEADHDGIRILFEENSISAETDSTFTDAQGYYSIDLVSGRYNISFTYPAYYGVHWPDEPLHDPITLPDVTLLPVLGDPIEGATSGVLEPGIYRVVGNLFVTEDSTLTIQAGTTFLFNTDASIECGANATLLCQGTVQDSIYFLPNVNGDHMTWGGIRFSGSEDDDLLQYCHVQGATGGTDGGGLKCSGSSPTFMNCTITGNTASYGAGLKVGGGSPTFSNCVIAHNTATGRGGGMYVGSVGAEFIGCLIEGNHAGGSGGGAFIDGGTSTFTDCDWLGNSAGSSSIYHGGALHCTSANVSVDGCNFFGNSAGSGGAVSLHSSSESILKHSVIRSNVAGNGAGLYIESGSPTIIHSTIVGNGGSDGGGIHSRYAFPVITNCAISENTYYGVYAYGGDPAVSYCDVYGNTNGDFNGNGVHPDLGSLVMTNANGDSCDAWLNISLDPMYVDPAGGDYHLLDDSPCIDAGDPDSPLDPDDTIADIGAFWGGPVPPEIAISHPAGGEVWQRGETYVIQWTDNLFSNVQIDLLLDGAWNEEIAADTQSDGSFLWDIPVDGDTGANFQIRITSLDDDQVFDDSEPFTLEYTPQPPLDVTLTADDPLVVPLGTAFSYGALITYNHQDLHYVDIWTEVTLPNGNLYGPIWQINNFPMGPGTVINAQAIHQTIPMAAPLGVYTYRMKAGVYPDVSPGMDSFDFEVVEATRASARHEDWISWGYREVFELAHELEQPSGTAQLPRHFAVLPVYPNPFNASATVTVRLPDAAELRIEVYNIEGREVARLAQGMNPAGEHAFSFDANGLASGLYFVRTAIPGETARIQKLMLVR